MRGIKPNSVRLDPLGITAQRKSPATLRVAWGFLFLHFRIQTAFNAQFEIKNPGALRQGFFFVAEGGEISNLKLVNDIIKILEFLDA